MCHAEAHSQGSALGPSNPIFHARGMCLLCCVESKHLLLLFDTRLTWHRGTGACTQRACRSVQRPGTGRWGEHRVWNLPDWIPEGWEKSSTFLYPLCSPSRPLSLPCSCLSPLPLLFSIFLSLWFPAWWRGGQKTFLCATQKGLCLTVGKLWLLQG